jgi:hypothetical protein
MKCKKVRHNFFLYNEKGLQDNVSHEISKHLDSCQDCRKYFQFIERVTDVSNIDLYKIKADPYFYTRLKAKLAERQKRNSLFPDWMQKRKLIPVLYTIFLIIAIILGINLGNFNNTSNSSAVIIQNTVTGNSDSYIDITSARQFIFENDYINIIENGTNKKTQIH